MGKVGGEFDFVYGNEGKFDNLVAFKGENIYYDEDSKDIYPRIKSTKMWYYDSCRRVYLRTTNYRINGTVENDNLIKEEK